jgi:hypothetical protein
MLIITDAAALARALDSPLDPVIRTLLVRRWEQLRADTGGDYELGELVQFVVVEADDEIAAIEADIGFPLFTEPAFEWVQDHDGWLEGIVILSDDGFGIALFVPDRDGIDPKMLSVMRDQAMRAN